MATSAPSYTSSTSNQGTSHSKILIIYDTTDKLDQISTLLSELDIMPKQVLIQAIIMEVNRDTLKDIGFDWGTGQAGANGYNTPPSDIAINAKNTQTIAGRSLASEFTPSLFNPLEGTTAFPGTYPYKAGLEVLFKKIAGTQFEVILHALEEDGRTNTLSKPIILTMNDQLASILIGTKFPIIQTQTSSENSYIVGGSLQQYMDIGIQLKVKPQICGSNEDYINLLLHPMVSSYTQTSKVTTQAGVTLVEYPIINTREAETQMIIKDGETIVMGGLLKDVKSHEDTGIPFLRKIPLLGNLFNRSTKDNSKIDLMIFITAKIVKPGEVLPQEVLNTQRIRNEFAAQENNNKKHKK
jgi:type II secretory pathway component GspD/PulD (secretin)